MNIEHLLRNTAETVGNSLEEKLISARSRSLQSILNYSNSEEHRFETVTKFSGITFINDAKSASVNSVYYALNRLKNPVVWITGGEDDEVDYLNLKELLVEKVKAIVFLGDSKNIKRALEAHVPEIYNRNNIYDAVSTAFYASENNDIVLLSPACSCGAEFKNYQNLGDLFKHAVAQL